MDKPAKTMIATHKTIPTLEERKAFAFAVGTALWNNPTLQNPLEVVAFALAVPPCVN